MRPAPPVNSHLTGTRRPTRTTRHGQRATTLIADLRAQLAAATDLAAKTQATLTRTNRTLSTIVQTGARDSAQNLPDGTLPYDPHRTAHRPGIRPKIASDPELQACIATRITRMTCNQLADEVANHFPEPRSATKSAIHDWWHKHGTIRPPARVRQQNPLKQAEKPNKTAHNHIGRWVGGGFSAAF